MVLERNGNIKRKLRNPLYDTAITTQHKLRPHNEQDRNNKTTIFGMEFYNKGTDLIYLPSIFKNKQVTKPFQNISNIPIMYHRYNNPFSLKISTLLYISQIQQSIRTCIFNYNQLVSDLSRETNIPTTFKYLNSKIWYESVGQFITGNFDIPEDEN